MRTIVPHETRSRALGTPRLQTSAFVMAVGFAIFVGWLSTFALLVSRW